MSAASTTIPRSPYTSEPRPSSARYNLFWPMLIFLLGSGTLEVYQVMSLEDQLDRVTQNVDKMDSQVKRAQYEKTKFFGMVKSVLQLAPTDPTAEKIAVYFKLQQLAAAEPNMRSINITSDPSSPNGNFYQSPDVKNPEFTAPYPSSPPPHPDAPVSK